VNEALKKLEKLSDSMVDEILSFIPDKWEINKETKNALKDFQ
jgi:hypothetical protein